MKNKRGITWETLMPWLIGVAVLVIIIIFAFILKDELLHYAGKIKDFFRLGG